MSQSRTINQPLDFERVTLCDAMFWKLSSVGYEIRQLFTNNPTIIFVPRRSSSLTATKLEVDIANRPVFSLILDAADIRIEMDRPTNKRRLATFAYEDPAVFEKIRDFLAKYHIVFAPIY